MKFSINKTELQNALAVVMKGTSTRSTLPILSGIYIETQQDSLLLQATDLELSIQYHTSALIDEPGKTVLPGKLFSDIVKSMPDAAIHLDINDNSAVITCDTSSFSIKTLSADDFPGFPHVDIEQEISVPFDAFASMVKRVARIVSKDESRGVLQGVLITLKENQLRLVATDSYRVAVTDAEIQASEAADFQAVILGSFLQEIASLPHSESPISIALSENQIVMKYQDTVFINRRIEGNYPNYQQLLPTSYATRIEIPTDILIAAVKRISLLSPNNSCVKFDINVDSQTLQLSSVAQDVGSAQEMLPATVLGEDNVIGFNYTYIIDGLTSIMTDKVIFEMQAPNKPGVLKADLGEDYLYLVMPVKTD
ncbi:DNA polymerase III subunit beta [Eggerthellaceae bacterium 3-80]|nr:DNA polymerase III subunit beta [bacterium D16-34]